MTARVELRLTGAVDHLRLVWQAGEALLESVPFREDPEGNRYNALLATQEMLTNVLRHAHRGDATMPVDLSMQVDDGGFSVEIRDRGPAFDPLAMPVSAPAQAPGELRTGGYGILIARMVMDVVEHRRDGEQNVLAMKKLVVTPVSAETRG